MNAFTGGLLALALISVGAQAGEKEIRAKVQAKLGAKVKTIAPSPVPGMFEVVAGNSVFYVSEDGNYVLSGNLYSLKDDKLTSLTEKRLDDVRLAAIKPYEASMIVFPAAQQKHVVTVFTDTDCGYCQRLHAHMKQYNDLGITIRYLAFPRAGLSSPAATELESVWCAKDQQAAMNLAKHRQQVPKASCADDPVPEHYQLGRSLNVTGTPSMILEDGTLVPGYLPPERLVQALEKQ